MPIFAIILSLLVSTTLFAKERYQCDVAVFGMEKQKPDLKTPMIRYSCQISVLGNTLEETVTILKDTANNTRTLSEDPVDLKLVVFDTWGFERRLVLDESGNQVYTMVLTNFELATASNSCHKFTVPDDIISIDPPLEKTVDCGLL